MKIFLLKIIFLFMLLLNHQFLNAQTVYTIHSDQVLHQIDEKIYGQFLEHIYNSVNNGLWGDLIWNRSFERQMLNWQKVGTIQMNRSGPALNSNYCVKLINSQPVEAGIEQSGLNLKVQPYRGSFWARGTTLGNIIIQLMQGTQSLAKKEFAAPGVDWQEFPFELKPTVETTNGTLRITFNDTGTVYLDQVSMMGQDAINNDGFRPDLFQAVEALHPPCIRWPGGTFAEHYRWKDGIGPQHERVVYPQQQWNDVDVNSFGTDEFIVLCRRLGAEPIIVINIGSHSSSVPPADYIEEAQHWVEYCNGTASSTWGSKRAANGHPEPYNVKYWEFGNEIFISLAFIVSDYVNFLNAFVPALKAVDSSIKIIASGCFDQNWNKTVINSCADIIDFISIHNYEIIENYQEGVRSYEAYVEALEGIIAASSNPNIKIYMSEWNVWDGIDWRNGLYAGGMLTMFERQGEYMHMACPALFLRHSSAGYNWNNALINFNNSSWFPAPNYVVMKFWRDHYAPNFLATDGSNTSLNVSTTRTEDSQEIYFKVINASAKDIPVQLEIDDSFTPRGARLEQIAPSALSTANSMEAPDNIRVEKGNVEIDNQQVNFTIPKYGAVIVTVSQDSTVGIDSHSNEDIQDYHLFTNYPNPFNPKTVISYQLAFNSKIILKVYNILGKEVTTLVNEEKFAGEYRVVFDASGLSSGVYFYTLYAISQENGTNFLQTKKFTLLK